MKTVLRVQEFETRLVPAAAIDSPHETYGWVLINTLRQNPSAFADNIQGLVAGTVNAAFGFPKADPVVTDLKAMFGRATSPTNYGAALALLRATPGTGPLAWDEVLEGRAASHVAWMKVNGFAHTGTRGNRTVIPGFASNNSAPTDTWGYGPPTYQSWGENIAWAVGSLSASKAAYNAGGITLAGMQQRAAFLETVSYILELNASSLGHLESLLGRDGGASATLPSYNVIGTEIDLYEAPVQNEAQDGIPEAWVSAQRFGLHRPNGTGGYVAGIAYQDANGNGFFDAGEGSPVTVDIRDSAGRGVTTTLSAGHHGAFSEYLPNGTYTLTASSAGAVLSTRSATIANSNAWADLQIAGVGRPTVSGPTGTQSTLRPRVVWNPTDGATAYQVRLDDATTGATNLFSGAATTENSWAPPADLVSGRKYTVLVRALRGTAPGPWSNPFGVVLGRPTPTGPGNRVGAIRPAFTWTPVNGAAGYEVRVNDMSAGLLGVHAARVTSPVWVPPSDLISGRTYSWQVRALNTEGLGRWTPLAAFAVGRAITIGPGGTVSGLRPTFTWAGLAGSTVYQVRVDDLTTGQTNVFLPLVSRDQAWTPGTDLQRGHTYRWWVRSVVPGPAGVWYGYWSAPQTFQLA